MLAIRSSTFDSLIIFCGSLIFFTLGLHAQEVIGFDSRFYLFAQEMWRHGVTWFPTTYQQPYPDYTAGSTILIYWASVLFGGLNKFTAVLPTAIAASLTLTFTYLIGALHARSWGLAAVCFLLMTLGFLQSARAISLDMQLTMITTLIFYLLYSTKNVRLIYALLLLGFMERGLIGLVMPTGVICIYYLLAGNIKQCFRSGFIALVLLILCTAILLGLAYQAGGNSFVQDVLRMQVLGRLNDHFLPYYFYFTNSLFTYAFSFPLACLVLIGLLYEKFLKKSTIPHANFILQLTGWMLVILLGMSIPGMKKSRYILPMLPALALMSAYLFMEMKQRYFHVLRLCVSSFLFILPLILASAIIFVKYNAASRHLILPLPFSQLIIFLLCLQTIYVIAIFKYRHVLTLLITSALTYVLIYLSLVEPITLYADRSRDFVRQVENQRVAQHAQLIFYKENPDNLPIKYIISMKQPEHQPIFVQALSQIKQAAFIVTSENYFVDLPATIKNQYHVLAQGKLGHVAVVVFQKNTVTI